MKLRNGDSRTRKCAQYVTKCGKRLPCDRPCVGFYCESHGRDWARPQLQVIGKEL